VSEQDLDLVPGKEHYAAKYVRGGRLFSYAHQMNAVLEYEPRTILEIGPGPGMVTAALRAISIDVTTVDVQPELEPDVVASVTDLPFEDKAFDVSMCCQVLEHLPFDQFVPALKELGRVSRRGVVISLPDCTPHYEIKVRLPKLGVLQRHGSRRRRPTAEYRNNRLRRDGHYWEIGFRGTELSDVIDSIYESGLSTTQSWRTPEMVWHRFFALGRRST